VQAIVIGSMIGCALLLFLVSRGQRKEETQETTGHEYDGIEELDNPLPKWWTYMFIGTIIFGFGYLGIYGLGKFNGIGTVTVDGQEVTWSSHNQWKSEVQAFDAKVAPLYAGYLATPIADLSTNEDALQTGERLYRSNCSVCHGNQAMGALGFPNLTDNDWLYGGTPDKIKETLLYGRQAAMPAWQTALGDEGVANMAQYVRSLSGLEHDAAKAEEAAPVFAQNCAVCHGNNGMGNQLVGAPNLTDQIWLYGGATRQIETTLRYGRNGRMPAQLEALGEAKVHILAAYIYSLSNK
ncbi:MAG: cytochrome-c oxidase, cbb3-type subunit III, partial [Oleibacter sp.]|nr:cytochrome-c oxidase, cbb3-type subunit III [Thalassolituus sp.]